MKPALIFFTSVSFVLLLFFPESATVKTGAPSIDINKTDSLLVAEDAPWSIRMAESFIHRHPDYNINYDERDEWNYEEGLMLQALYKLFLRTNNGKYYNYIIRNLDRYLTAYGTIKTYKFLQFRLDDITPGVALLNLYQRTGEEKYKIAADTLRKQLKLQPRTKEGGFWHKEIYPNQMWLDGLFMAEPFYAQFAEMFKEPSDFDDIAEQFILIYKHTRDSKTGLLFHAWDSSREQKWADPETGVSLNFWGRAVGWYEMALVDVLDYFPEGNPRRKELINILKETSDALLKYKDDKTGTWYQVLDKGGKEGNYLEASCSCMFAYAFAKGANKGYLNKKFYKIAEDSFNGIIENFIKVDESGLINILNTCMGAGLGGNPYRDGSFDYYVSVPQRTNDFKAVGPFILASMELNK